MNPSDLLALFTHATKAPLFDLGSQTISVLWLGECTLLLAAVVAIARLSRHLLSHRLLVGVVRNPGDRVVIANLASIVLGVTAGVIALQAMGLQLSNLAIVVGGIGVGIGFGAQELTRNLVSGLTLISERKLKVGDLVEFKGISGHIQEISMRTTVIRTAKGSAWIVPNTQLASVEVENWSYQTRRGRIDIPLTVPHQSDLVRLTELLMAIAHMEAAVLSDPAPKVLFLGFGETGFNMELRVWIEHIDRGATVKSNLNYLIEFHGRQSGILVAQSPADASKPVKAEAGVQALPTLRQTLSALPYFETFDEIQLRDLIEWGVRKSLNPGEVYVAKGQRHPAFCVVLEGAVDAILENERVSQRVFQFAAGDFFGEVPTLLDLPYPTTMRASGTTTLFEITAKRFRALLDRHPALKEQVMEEVTRRQASLELSLATLRELGTEAEDRSMSPAHWIRKRLSKLLSECRN